MSAARADPARDNGAAMTDPRNEPEKTHFGFEQVPRGDKARRVKGVFDSVARRYDLMNDLMSFGIHRLWKRIAVELAAVRPGHLVLDLAAGTGDLTEQLTARAGTQGHVVAADINDAMLRLGRDRLLDKGLAANVSYVQADAEHLPFPDNQFDCVTMAFGLRNVTDKKAALAALQRVLRPGGKLLVLEFSTPTVPLINRIYEQYSFRVLPLLGKLVTGDEASYRYLSESIRVHPDQETLKTMMEGVGLTGCDYFNVTTGIVALHRGYKP